MTTKLDRLNALHAARMVRALARGDESAARRAEARGDEDAAYEEFERAGMRLDHAEPLTVEAR